MRLGGAFSSAHAVPPFHKMLQPLQQLTQS
jgi:hypothetical protein